MVKLTDRDVREKLASRGVASLSDAELLSLLLRDGVSGRSALEVAEKVLEAKNGSLEALADAGIAELRMLEGIGMVRASILACAFELAARMRHSGSVAPMVIKDKDDAVTLMAPVYSSLKHEEMWVLYLSSANGLIEKRRVSQGGVKTMVVDNKLIIKRAIELLASSIIIVHNHPSGVVSPSVEDIELTSQISEAAALFDILLVDHIIIAGSSSYSFRDHSLLR